jgi:putative ABC transport system ATP-binding protein
MGPSGSASRPCCTRWPGWTPRRPAPSSSGTPDITSLSDTKLTLLRRDKLGFIFQSFNLLPTLTALENITLPCRSPAGSPTRSGSTRSSTPVGLRERLSHRPSELSGGQQQRVAAARALASRPQIVFADEPTGALDSRAAAELLGFLRGAVHELGQTVVMVTHDPVAASYADRVVFLGDGRIVDEMTDPTPEKVLDLMKRLGA